MSTPMHLSFQLKKGKADETGKAPIYVLKTYEIQPLNEIVDEVKNRLVKESKTNTEVYNYAEVDAYNKAMRGGAKWENLKHTTLVLDHKTGIYMERAVCQLSSSFWR